MDPNAIELVRSTYAAAASHSDRVSQVFYERLFGLDPAVRAMFPDDMNAQRQKLMDELTLIVESLGNVHALVARTTDLGARHAGYGVEAHHYELVLDALIHALCVCVPDVMDAAAIAAWRRAYHLIAETMLHGALHGPSGSA